MPQSDPHHPSLPTATGALARLAAQEARAAGFDLGPLLKTAGLTAAQIDDADERLSVKAQIAFVEAVARAMGRHPGATHEIIQPVETACTHHSRQPACDAPAC